MCYAQRVSSSPKLNERDNACLPSCRDAQQRCERMALRPRDARAQQMLEDGDPELVREVAWKRGSHDAGVMEMLRETCPMRAGYRQNLWS
jgi:hypothetical protein